MTDDSAILAYEEMTRRMCEVVKEQSADIVDAAIIVLADRLELAIPAAVQEQVADILIQTLKECHKEINDRYLRSIRYIADFVDQELESSDE